MAGHHALLSLLSLLLHLGLASGQSLLLNSGETIKPAPEGYNAGSDQVAPFPPAAPMLPQVDVGSINSIADVCSVCTKRSYDSHCYSDYTVYCLNAMQQYLKNVLNVKDTYCGCYGIVFAQLTLSCPGMDRRFVGNTGCDRYCFWGQPCPASPVLFSVLKPGYVALANDATSSSQFQVQPASTGTIAAAVDVRADLNGGTQFCYNFETSWDAPSPLQQASVRLGFFGQAGPAVQYLYRGNQGPSQNSLSNCVGMPKATALAIAWGASDFYLSVATANGSLRGQLVPALSMRARATADGAGQGCTKSRKGSTCKADVGLMVAGGSLQYSIAYSKAPLAAVRAANIQQQVWDQGASSPSLAWPPLLTLFGVGAAKPSTFNTMGLDSTSKAQQVMMGGYAVNITSKAHPRGALVGGFTESLTLEGTLNAAQVVTRRSRLKGSLSFSAQVGPGGICYNFTSSTLRLSSLAAGAFAFLQSGVPGETGGVAYPRSLSVATPRISCVKADASVTGPILASPDAFYVQVYTGINSPILRGQLSIAATQKV